MTQVCGRDPGVLRRGGGNTHVCGGIERGGGGGGGAGGHGGGWGVSDGGGRPVWPGGFGSLGVPTCVRHAQVSGRDTGLCALLLLLLGVPGLPQPPPEGPPSLCDPRVIERFILEARDAERGAAGCGPHCDLPEPVAVPDPGVNFNLWRSLDAGSRAQEVAGGQAALVAAVLRARELLRDPRVRPSLDRAYGAARSLARLLRGLPAPAPAPAPVRVQTLPRLLGVLSRFLRGKVRLYLADTCPR
ncbi:erythropoietin [Cinclus cinclus]|uniref:erythropoietin n=1 Tax=Cinclus cinclus TaxID=127875 RepID=UPI002E1396C9